MEKKNVEIIKGEVVNEKETWRQKGAKWIRSHKGEIKMAVGFGAGIITKIVVDAIIDACANGLDESNEQVDVICYESEESTDDSMSDSEVEA